MDYSSVAAALYDGGWRTYDMSDIIEEYALSKEEARGVYQELDKIEIMNMCGLSEEAAEELLGAVSDIEQCLIAEFTEGG